MKSIASVSKYKFILSFMVVVFSLSTSFAQTTRVEAMEKLRFMVGDWVGISKAYENDAVIKQVPASEKIDYKLDRHIITIDLKSESLLLHTVIYYDENDKTYYYNPYYKSGAAKYAAEFIDGKLIVWPNESKRFVFGLTPEGDFQEYGEKLEDGKWVKYFEDIFKKN